MFFYELLHMDTPVLADHQKVDMERVEDLPGAMVDRDGWQ